MIIFSEFSQDYSLISAQEARVSIVSDKRLVSVLDMVPQVAHLRSEKLNYVNLSITDTPV